LDEQYIEYDGMVGVGPCPDGLKEYSFVWQLLNYQKNDTFSNVKVKKLEWW